MIQHCFESVAKTFRVIVFPISLLEYQSEELTREIKSVVVTLKGHLKTYFLELFRVFIFLPSLMIRQFITFLTNIILFKIFLDLQTACYQYNCKKGKTM